MKSITEQAYNNVTIAGKLLDTSFRTVKSKDGTKTFESATATIRATHVYGGREETSDIPVSFFSSQFNKNGSPSGTYESIQKLKSLSTAQQVGFADAATICVPDASISENDFVSRRSNQIVSGININGRYFNEGPVKDTATFNMNIFIMDMHEEMDREENPTGRLIIKGGIVQYNSKLDVLEFVVEMPECVEHISRNWSINDTVNIRGRVRFTSVEEKQAPSEASWGEDIPQVNTRMARELVITTGSPEPIEEEFAYDSAEIKKGFNARKARLEQMLMDAKNKPAASAAAPAQAPTRTPHTWEEDF